MTSTLVDADRAGVGRDQADDHVEAGRLAGAVRAEQADDLALVEREFEAAHDRAAAEALLQVRWRSASVLVAGRGLGLGRGFRRVGLVGRGAAALFFGSMTICTRWPELALSPLSISPVFVL